jgi:tetratricopeptide (TPR) repeat protein
MRQARTVSQELIQTMTVEAGPLGAAGEDDSWLSSSVSADLVEQFAEAWSRGECPSVETFLAGLAPGDVDEETSVRLIYEEMCLRRSAGRAMSSDEVGRRFPEWCGKLERLLDCERLLAGPAAPSGFPEVGDEIGPFRLLSELGRGALGRVFLAAQPALSDRPVVVKVTPQRGQEHLSLARLQHTGIVPLYLAQDFHDRKVRLLCMPYLGGMTLDRFLDALAAAGGARSGRDVAQVVEQASRDEPAPGAHHGPALQFLERASYLQAVCWIGACLADALHYAHQRGLAHFDVKPSNVLLAGDGQPMLLDFHLARGAVQAGERRAWLGGTTGYMSPEQEGALAALRQGREVPSTVDYRSDIYSLGVLLDEMRRKGKTESAPRLEAIVRKCLARRLLAMLALAGIWGSIGAVRLRQARAALAENQTQLKTVARCERARRLVGNLHLVTDRLRWIAANETEAGQSAKRLEATCRPLWERRRQFLEAAASLDAASQQQVREDLVELALLWAGSESAATRRDGEWRRRTTALLAQAEQEFGPDPLLMYLLNPKSNANATRPPAVTSSWEHYILGRALLREEQITLAYEILERGAAQFPDDLWLQFTLAECAVRLELHEEALAAFSACVALAPDHPEPRRCRAALYRNAGRPDLAQRDEQLARRLVAD